MQLHRVIDGAPMELNTMDLIMLMSSNIYLYLLNIIIGNFHVPWVWINADTLNFKFFLRYYVHYNKLKTVELSKVEMPRRNLITNFRELRTFLYHFSYVGKS